MIRIRYILNIALLLLLGAATPAFAQTIKGNIYGGGEMALVEGNTSVTISSGLFGGSIFGGGEGKLGNDGTVSMSADIGTHNDDGTLVENTGDTHVTINGGEIVYSVGDKENLRNIYGGGNLACNVAGSTNVTMTKGMITTYSFTSSPLAMAAWRHFYDNSMKPNQQKIPICSVFGAGYGAHTDVAGNTNVDINIPGTADIHPADGTSFTHDELEAIDKLALRLKPDTKLSEQFVPSIFGGGFDGTVGAYDADAYKGAGGINYDKTTCTSQTNITIQGQPFVFNVYGGGLGSKSGADATGGVNSYVGAVYGATKVDIQGGLYNGSVFGGGAGIEAEQDISNPFTGVGTIKMPYTYAAQVMRETDVTISGNTTIIYGNVYGGGDIANTGWYYESARPKMDGHVAQQNHSLATLDFTTSLKLNGGNILGSAFGGGNGRTKAQMTMSMFVGTVCGSTNVSLSGTKVWSHVYGGGNMGTVFTCQTIAASKGESGRAMATGVIDGCTNVAILDGMVAKDIYGGGFGDDPGTGDANVTSADIYGNTYVYFEKADLEYSKYWKPREFLSPDATDEQMLAEVTGRFLDQSSAGPKRNTESDITHNLYGGGNMACDVRGNTHVYMVGAPTAPADFSTTDYYKECIANVAKPHFSVFGGGFGNKATVTQNAYCDINLRYGTGLHSIVGGGLNGTVGGMCQVHVGNDPQSLVHFVYGGGYYAPCAGTNLDITRGTILENVYGGAVMGNIHAAGASTEVATNTTIGLKSEGANSSVVFKDENDQELRSYTYDDHKNLIIIGGDVYGGNDVSGTVNGIAQLTVYGGEIKGNVYGAGNGNHIGYYIPGALKYDMGTHGSDNYFMVDHSGEGGPKGKTYVGRPQTIGGVNLTLEGNTKDERVTVLGQVFGGGNSCTIGAWDKTLLTTTYAGNPHLVRDDPAYFLGGGTLDINLGSHVTIGRTHEQLIGSADETVYIDNHENVSGLFMGCSGKDLATQTGAKADNHYHHFFSPHAKHYYPGFVVYDEHGDPMSRAEQLKPFQAYLNNIMVWSDNVRLNIPDDAEDIWLANFVGGGFRGSMRAKTLENGRFDYTLPEGVTVSHTIIGGAYNAHVQYRVFATNDDGTFIDEDADGKYDYLTVVPGGWKQMDPAHPTAECDYIKTLHEDEDDPEKITGILRYNFNGGMLSINSTGVSSSPEGRHIHQVHADPRANEAEYATAYFEPMTAGSTGEEDDATKAKLFSANKNKTLLHLTLKCALEPEVLPKNDGSGKNYAHGGNVFGGCFMSGFVEGDSWVDYHCWLAPKCANSKEEKYKYFFNKQDNMHIYDDAGDLETNNALSVYGAGYGADTHSDGDVYLYIKSIAHHATGDADPAGMFPYIFNAFGGSNMGTVSGNTNVYYAVGQQGTLLGSLYGGGYKGVIEGNTFVEMAEGFAHNVYGGSRQADIHGASHVWAYDGKARGITNANHLIICNLYGGNDIAGTISGTMPAKFTETKWNAAPNGENTPRPSLTDKRFNTYVEISADDNSADRGFPLVGSAFAGGNGEEWKEGAGASPNVETALLEIEGGSTLRAFGGGNMATVTGNTYIFANAESDNFANVTFSNYQKTIMTKVFFSGMKSGFRWEENTLTIDPYHVVRLFGGNNLAAMDIQPTWNLWRGKLENVYSGGNMGDMTYYNPSGVEARTPGSPGSPTKLGVENLDGTNANLNPKGLSINIDSPDIRIGSLFGGCRLSDVRPNDDDYDDADKWPTFDAGGEDCYGATVNVIEGNIGYIFGGNDVSGKVEHGTNINICGGVIGQVYGSGNGDYLFKYIPDADDDDSTAYTDDEKADTRITEHMSDEYGIYYTVPENDSNGTPWDDSSTGDTHKIMTINKIRPSVDNAFINIAGLAPEHNAGTKRITLIKGNVYMGGNATTITRGNEEAFTKFKYGSYAVAGGLYMGSDGQDYTQNDVIQKFATLNGIEDMGAGTSFPDPLEKAHNPILLNAYLTAVDMDALPKEFAAVEGLRETYVGTLCGGGNRGSMLVNKTVELTVPAQITIFDKVVAGCNDATISYNQGGTTIKSVGGYTRMVDVANNDGKGNVKINYNIAAQFAPLTLDVPMGTDLRIPVNRTDLNNHNETWTDAIKHAFLWPRLNDAGDAYTTGCNIYGGCYSSGEIEGDVVLNIYSNMLRYANETKLRKAIDNDEACFNIFGAGYGQESHVWGNVHITLNKSVNARLAQPETSPIDAVLLANPYLDGQNALTTFDRVSANNIFGGGRNGQLIGNTTIELRNGRVYSDVAGGCFASDMYGSSHIIVGYPTYYKCKTSGEYQLQRGDQWNGDKNAIKTSVRYLKGDLVPKNVYDQMTDGSKNTKFDPIAGAPADWSAVNIQIGKGIYGGGYSLANSTSASAGSITSHKLQAAPDDPEDLQTLHPLNFNGRYGLEAELSTVGYGGNSAIMVGDQAGDGTTDHISISTLKATEATIPVGGSVIGKFVRESNGKYSHQSDGPAVVGKQYYDLSGDGGIYGDGHLTFCEGFRAADVTGYGYNTGTVKYPKLMNTFQRLDLLDISDCCLMLQGAQDFATTEKVNATIYSMTRIGELRMNSTLDASGELGQISAVSGSGDGANQDDIKQRNYLGFFNNIHYLGSIVTNDDFASATFHKADGTIGSANYKAEKTTYITNYTNAVDKNTALATFKKRNVGTARNVIGINNGYCLRIQNQYSYDDNGTTKLGLYYGPIIGVCEVKLLTLTQGEGGGYVYADNIHANADNFLNTSGNFVFPGVVKQGNDGGGHPIADQYIVDDCFVDKFGTSANLTQRDGDLDEAHYWYVEGNKYFFNTTLTGYTFQDPITFNLTDNDPNIVLSGIKDGSKLNVKRIEWLSTHRDGYDCVLENSTPGKIDDYEFDLDVNGSSAWTTGMPRYTNGMNPTPLTTDKTLSSSDTPVFNVKLQDKKNNSGDDNYTNHLDEPEKVKIYLEGETDGQTYEYTISMNIVYLQGPTYEGGVTIENCALPGERIGFSTSGITIKTPNLMPVTAVSWKIMPWDKVKGEWTNNGAKVIPNTQYSEVDGQLTGWVPALYNHNEYNIAYTFTAGGHEFPVMPKQDAPLKQNRMMVVHNYHRMKDIVAQHIEESIVAGARVYISNVEDMMKFVEWVNAGQQTEGVDFILQDNVTLTSSITLFQPFAGTFHGDGYHIDLNGNGASLFGSQLTGKVYNLGLIGGTIASTGMRTNCFEYANNDDYTYGVKAYELSHAFTPATDVSTYGNYVHNLYANGDYQYATTDCVWSLRTAAPNYGNTDTHHDVAHTHDAARWIDTDNDDEHNDDILMHTGYNQPLYDGTLVIPDKDVHDGTGSIIGKLHGLPESYANDYLFFGQHLDKENADAYPVHIEPVAKGDAASDNKGGNRVYKTAGYHQSSTDDGFFYNRDAWALQPTLTAIDYTNRTAEDDNASTMPTKFSADSNADYLTDDEYDNSSYGHVTQNLLIYCNGEDIFNEGLYPDNTSESKIRYHRLKDSSVGGTFGIDYFHLVDKQDFNAPRSFNVDTRAWYERRPQIFRNADDYPEATAWEGLCLPFQYVNKVMGEEDGNVLSHFYGQPTEAMLENPATNDRTLHHEYWLTGMTAAESGHATFMRPSLGAEDTAGELFDNGTYCWGYDYENTYYRDLPNYGSHVDSRDDESSWYESAHTFANYPFIHQNAPYLVSFPGEGFYEFDLTDQIITFENRPKNYMPISATDYDDSTFPYSTTVNGHKHVGTYMHVVADESHLGINDTGTTFEDSYDILPFRTYMTAVSGPSPLRRIRIVDGGGELVPREEPEQQETVELPLRIYVDGSEIVVESSLPMSLPVHSVGGIRIATIDVQPGITRQPMLPGIYIVRQRKYAVK